MRTRRYGGRRPRPHGRLKRVGARRDQSAGDQIEDLAAVHARRPDRKGEPEHHEDRADAAERLRHRLVRLRGGLEAPAPGDGLGRERRHPEDHLDRRQRSDRRGCDLPVPRQSRLEQDLHIRGAADVLGRLRGRLERTRLVGHAGAGDRGEVLARRRRQLDLGDHRACRWRDRRPARRRRAGNSRREPAGGMRRIVLMTLAAAAASLALPAAAWAHAALLQTTPVASRIVNTQPRQVLLRYSEPVEPRFAIVSVTNAAGDKQTAGVPSRSPENADTLVVPLKKLPEGWYLVYWRVISVDGHPVRGAFTFAVGPNAGPAPQFVIPSVSETAATPELVTARWIAFLTVMSAIGIFFLRMLIARPLVRRVSGTTLRALSIAFFAVAGLALVAVPVYVLIATAQF